jgi:hypothetical protein
MDTSAAQVTEVAGAPACRAPSGAAAGARGPMFEHSFSNGGASGIAGFPAIQRIAGRQSDDTGKALAVFRR